MINAVSWFGLELGLELSSINEISCFFFNSLFDLGICLFKCLYGNPSVFSFSKQSFRGWFSLMEKLFRVCDWRSFIDSFLYDSVIAVILYVVCIFRKLLTDRTK